METFIKTPTNLFSTVKLLPIERNFIAYIISFQSKEKRFYESNPSTAKNIGTNVSTIKKMITFFKKHYSSFFIHTCDKDRHTISINLIELNKFLADDKPKIVKPRSIKKETTSTNFNYRSQDGTPKEIDTSSYDEGGTCVNISKTNRVVLSNDYPKEVSTPQQEEIVPQIKDNTSNINSWVSALPTALPQPKVEEIEDGVLKDYKFYKNRLEDLFPSRRRKGEKIAEWDCILYLKQSWDAGKITSTNQVTKENLNRIIDKFKKNE